MVRVIRPAPGPRQPEHDQEPLLPVAVARRLDRSGSHCLGPNPCSERLNGSGPERPQPAAFTARPGAGRCSESWSCRNRRSRRRVGPGPAGAGPCPGPAQAGTMVRDLRLRHGHGDAHAQELAESGRALPPRQGRSWSRHQDGRQQDSESEPAGAAGHSQATATIVLVPCRRIAAMLQDGPPGPLDRTLAIGFGPRPA